jgi:hypothetical protein
MIEVAIRLRNDESPFCGILCTTANNPFTLTTNTWKLNIRERTLRRWKRSQKRKIHPSSPADIVCISPSLFARYNYWLAVWLFRFADTLMTDYFLSIALMRCTYYRFFELVIHCTDDPGYQEVSFQIIYSVVIFGPRGLAQWPKIESVSFPLVWSNFQRLPSASKVGYTVLLFKECVRGMLRQFSWWRLWWHVIKFGIPPFVGIIKF